MALARSKSGSPTGGRPKTTGGIPSVGRRRLSPKKVTKVVPHLFSADQQSQQKEYMSVVYKKPEEYSTSAASALSARGAEHRSQRYFMAKIKHSNETITRVSRDSHAYFSAHFARAYAYSRIGAQNKAVEDYKICADHNPKCAMVFGNLAAIMAEQGDLQASIANFNKAVKLDPQNRDYHHNRSLVLRQTGDFLGALTDVIGMQNLSAADTSGSLRRRRMQNAAQTIKAQSHVNKIMAAAREKDAASRQEARAQRKDEMKKKQQLEIMEMLDRKDYLSARALARSYGFSSMVDRYLWDVTPNSRSDRHVEELMQSVRTLTYFAKLPREVFFDLCKTMQLQKFPKGHTIFRNKDAADAFFVLFRGAVTLKRQVVKDEIFGETEVLEEHKWAGDCFGDEDLSNKAYSIRHSTATCDKDVEVLVLSKGEFSDLVAHEDELLTEDRLRLLRDCTIFSQWPETKLQELVRYAKAKSFQPHQRILTQGDPADCMMLVKSGVCRIWRTIQIPSEETLRAQSRAWDTVDASTADARANAPLDKLPQYWVIGYGKAKRKTLPGRQGMSSGGDGSVSGSSSSDAVRRSSTLTAAASASNLRRELGSKKKGGGREKSVTVAMLARAEVFGELVLIDPHGKSEVNVDTETKVEVIYFTQDDLEKVEAPFQGNTVSLLQQSYRLHNPPDGKVIEMYQATDNWKKRQGAVMKDIKSVPKRTDWVSLCGRPATAAGCEPMRF
jgi:CRP-like cAMP-binding protein/tetratricopeptide (TPR) repeat protein